jgi:hypothetical protein
MVSLFKARKAPIEAGPDPEEIQRRINATREKIGQLEHEHSAASLAWATGEAPDASELNRIDEALETARREERALVAALALANAKAAQVEQERVEAIKAQKINACVQHLRARDVAAEEYQTALAVLVTAWRKLLDTSEKARNAWPQGMPPLGANLNIKDLQRLVSWELFRQAGDPSLNGTRGHPGCKPPSTIVLNNPDGVVPLSVSIRETSDWLINSMKGKTVVAAPSLSSATPGVLASAIAPPKALAQVEQLPKGQPISTGEALAISQAQFRRQHGDTTEIIDHRRDNSEAWRPEKASR